MSSDPFYPSGSAREAVRDVRLVGDVGGTPTPLGSTNPLPVSSPGLGVLASNGKTIYPDNEAVTLAYTNGVVTSLTLTTGGTTYVQTIGRDGSGNVTSLSKWVAQ